MAADQAGLPAGADEPSGAVVWRLAAGMVGDLSAVMTAVASNAALAERHAAGNPQLVRLLRNIQSAAMQGQVLTQHMAALAPGSTGIAADQHEFSESGPGGRILVVEDDLQVAEVAIAVLEDLGHVVNHSVDAVSAWAVLQAGEFYDLVFSDIVMPGGMSGIDLAEEISHNFPHLPILLATGYSSAALAQGALRFPVLAKPYSVQELARRVSQLMPHQTKGLPGLF